MNFAFALLLVVVQFCSGELSVEPTVQTPVGTIIGLSRSFTVYNEDIITNRFLGVPYAKPPTGQLRFQRSEPAEVFEIPFHAKSFGAICPQVVIPVFPIFYESMSEDCLFLNIFQPTTKPDAPEGHAVMVFIHGGGFILGSGDMYVGDALSAYGNVIVVTFNYRLGLFGFLSTSDSRSSGNVAFWDQRLALQWVTKNIGAFGGDPSRVTIFGQSAGSYSVIAQALYPGNMGLFQRIIAESGTPSISLLVVKNPEAAVQALSEALECNLGLHVVDCMESKTYNDILTAIDTYKEKFPEKSQSLVFGPSVDGEFFKRLPTEMTSMAKSKPQEEIKMFRSVDVMIGWNNFEAASAIPYIAAGENVDDFLPSAEKMNNEYIPTFMNIMQFGSSDLVKKLLAAEYTNWTHPNDPRAIRIELLRLLGDSMMPCQVIEYAQLHCNGSTNVKTFVYEFAAAPSYHIIDSPAWLEGANHGDELGFVFGFHEEMVESFRKLKKLDKAPEPSDLERQLSRTIMRYWSNFAKTGNPSSPVTSSQEWPPYDMTIQQGIVLNENIGEKSVKPYFFARVNNFWNNILKVVIENDDAGNCEKDGNCS